MPTHVALLRGVNVGGVKVVMAELRQVLTALGYAGVSTYIQSGNVLFTATEPDTLALAREIEGAVAASFGLKAPTAVVLTRDELAQAVAANPYPGEPNPKFVHAVFLPADPDPGAERRLAEVSELVAAQGSKDEAVLIGRTAYLHTPGGFGRSELAAMLLAKRASVLAAGTARNWSTVTKLLALCDADG
jgi:uncharacterized protein (DUF1697 family)